MQTLVDHQRQLVDDAIMNWKPMEFTQDRSDVVKVPGLRRDTSCGMLNSLTFLQQSLVLTLHSRLLQSSSGC